MDPAPSGLQEVDGLMDLTIYSEILVLIDVLVENARGPWLRAPS
jgi:hypothetical protein